MIERLLVAGAGGQGVIFTGKIVAMAGMKQAPHVTFFPSYGAEVRGGTSNCQVILSSEEIASPVAETFESMILMNQESVARFRSRLAGDGLVIVNGSMCNVARSPGVVSVDASEAAAGLGLTASANLIMLGVYVKARGVLDSAVVKEEITAALSRKSGAVTGLNMKAFELGLRQG
ncbi:2-oxoacid:acceptor oxidoreductase family protein [Verrucomicrobiota bacterium]